MMNASENAEKYIASLTSKQLAFALGEAVAGTTDVMLDLAPLARQLTDEAYKRVGTAATKAGDLAQDQFDAHWGIKPGMDDEQLDAIYDQVPDDELLPGDWFYLVAELRK